MNDPETKVPHFLRVVRAIARVRGVVLPLATITTVVAGCNSGHVYGSLATTTGPGGAATVGTGGAGGSGHGGGVVGSGVVTATGVGGGGGAGGQGGAAVGVVPMTGTGGGSGDGSGGAGGAKVGIGVMPDAG